MTESSPVSHIQPEHNARLGGCGHPVPSTIAKESVGDSARKEACLDISHLTANVTVVD